MSQNESTLSWNTEKELEFIANIGTYSVTPTAKKAALQGYIASCKNRFDWYGIKKSACVKFAKEKLKNYEN